MATLIQVDWESRMPYPNGLGGFYYWTNTFYGFSEYNDPAWELVLAIDSIYENCTLHSCQQSWYRVTAPPHSGDVVRSDRAFNEPGHSLYPDNAALETCARVAFYAGDRYVGYKLLRGAVPMQMTAKGVLNDTIWGYLQTNYADALVNAGITTAAGEAITSAVLSRRLHGWVIRHGSKRAARTVIEHTEVP